MNEFGENLLKSYLEKQQLDKVDSIVEIVNSHRDFSNINSIRSRIVRELFQRKIGGVSVG